MTEEKSLDQEILEGEIPPVGEPETEQDETQGRGFSLPQWIMAETGDGPIESYIEHPLNFNQSRGFAQILRGLSGILGNLKLAVIDISLGVLQVLKERKPPASA